MYLTDAIAQVSNPSWIIPVKHLPAHWSLHAMHTLERVGTLFALAKRAWGCVIGNSKIPQTTSLGVGLLWHLLYISPARAAAPRDEHHVRRRIHHAGVDVSPVFGAVPGPKSDHDGPGGVELSPVSDAPALADILNWAVSAPKPGRAASVAGPAGKHRSDCARECSLRRPQEIGLLRIVVHDCR